MDPDVRSLLDRSAIADLLAAYCRALDTMELDGLRDVFAAEASVAFGPDPRLNATGQEAILAALSRLWRWRRTAHHLGPVEVAFESADRARARSPVIAWHERPDGTTATLYGVYLDELERRPEGWRIVHRRQEMNGSEPPFPIGIFPAPRRPPPPGWTPPDIESGPPAPARGRGCDR